MPFLFCFDLTRTSTDSTVPACPNKEASSEVSTPNDRFATKSLHPGEDLTFSTSWSASDGAKTLLTKFDRRERGLAEATRMHGLSGRMGNGVWVLEPWVVEDAGREEVKKQTAEDESAVVAIFGFCRFRRNSQGIRSVKVEILY